MDKNHNFQPPLLPVQWTSAYITYWSPMKQGNFISSGSVWFDYESEVYRIDGIFNPWDVEKTGYQLWMSEVTFYGQGKSLVSKLPYHIKQENDVTAAFNYDVAELEGQEVKANNSIVPRDILITGKATFQGTEKILGMEVDCWEFERDNPFNMHRFYLKKGSNELVRMQQFKNGQMLIRDLPNPSTDQIDQKVFKY
ncbi:violacein biosynthesis enzyme VioE [Nostoc sp. XA010]|uniref:violacein biosynthesis enzyme VioE n=1 Tax=Nostoc sp. XA010 TaxID=2780407 RepID=UPI001E3A8F8B|nr:violacein biosynthesis enzyme VioE [Nostoc sp. XA010]MCC5661246.1 violacein biosynthesis enzyme VioE [Nostoc sp. XA010]